MAPALTQAVGITGNSRDDSASKKVKPNPSSDPTVYDIHHKNFISDGLPTRTQGWLDRARSVVEIFAADAAARDIENKSPEVEVALLKSSGLLKVLGSKKYGGGGENWETGYKVIREVAKGDGSSGMLLGYHLLWSTTANVVGSEEQKERAVNPRDNELNITDLGDHLVFDGFNNFNTGVVVSDLTVLEGVYAGTDCYIFAFVPTQQDGIQFANNVGLRLTESGSVKISQVSVPWSDALGWGTKPNRPIQRSSQSPLRPSSFLSFNLCSQIFISALRKERALDFASKYTTKSTRAWPYGGDNKEKATEELYILERYGNFFAHLRATETPVDRAGLEISNLYIKHNKRGASEPERGDAAEWMASAKVVTTDTALGVTVGVFDVTGIKATSRNVGLDRFWRDVRTHTLHEPVTYKNRELREYVLLDKVPQPTWYT